MRYPNKISESALAELKGLPKEVRRNIGFRLDHLCEDLHGDVKKRKAEKDHYRLRVGQHRVLFRLAEGVIEVYAVRNRRDAYE